MTTYDTTNTTNTVISYKKGITIETVRALRDNPLAMFEGAAGAPRLAYEAMDTWYSTYGALGSYVFARYSGGADKTAGVTVAGSTLQPTSAARSVGASSTPGSAAMDLGSALSGTWQCMGRFDNSDTDGTITVTGATLWQRVA